MVSKKAPKFAHTDKSKIGMGDFYGTGVKNRMGKPKEVLGQTIGKAKGTSKPPRSLA